MDMPVLPVPVEPVVYPESDGEPMAENTLQYQWIVYFRENIAAQFADRTDVLVAADNLIYPVEGEPTITMAPDVYVAFGRPPGRRGSYRVWDEAGIFPQVVIEILSPSNTRRSLQRKRAFYRRHGAEEYIIYDPDEDVLEIWVREGQRLIEVEDPNGWVSPRLKIRFDTSTSPMTVFRSNGNSFVSFQELEEQRDQFKEERDQFKEERDQFKEERDQFKEERDQFKEERDQLLAKLRELGVDPTAP